MIEEFSKYFVKFLNKLANFLGIPEDVFFHIFLVVGIIWSYLSNKKIRQEKEKDPLSKLILFRGYGIIIVGSLMLIRFILELIGVLKNQ